MSCRVAIAHSARVNPQGSGGGCVVNSVNNANNNNNRPRPRVDD